MPPDNHRSAAFFVSDSRVSCKMKKSTGVQLSVYDFLTARSNSCWSLSCCHGNGDVRRHITAERICWVRMLCRHYPPPWLLLLLLLLVLESLSASRHVLPSRPCVITSTCRQDNYSIVTYNPTAQDAATCFAS